MKMPEITQEQKDAVIANIKEGFAAIGRDIATLEQDLESDDMMMQTSAVFVASHLVGFYGDFKQQLRNLEKQKDNIQKEIENLSKTIM